MLPRQILSDCIDAWAGLRRRALRSLLSGLGIGIGVIALVAMLSIGEGAKLKALDKIASLGINTLRVEDAALTARLANKTLVNLSQGLTEEDAHHIVRWLGSKGTVGAYAREENVAVIAGTRSQTSTVVGATPAWLNAEKLQLYWGRSLLPDDSIRQRRICILGSRIATLLQVHTQMTLRLANTPCTVIGVLEPRGRLLTEGTGLSALDFDNTVIMPLEAFPFIRTLAGRRLLDGLVISLFSEEETVILETARQIEGLLRKRHRGIDDFRLVVPLNLLREARETQQLFALVMGSIAGLSLLVGGIGVMNIMLANISEQTREIGLRMAVGATRGRIISLYLWHSVLLTLAGGIWGVLGGVLLAMLIQHYAGLEVAFSSLSLVLGPGSAMIMGLIFGLHPAHRAASLDPALALREA